MNKEPSQELKELANYVLGFGDANQNHNLCRAAEWLEKASRNVCGQGFFGCHGGPKCNSDHK